MKSAKARGVRPFARSSTSPTSPLAPPTSPHPHDALIGALLVVASGFGYGAVAVLARVAFEGGSNAPTSLVGRFGLAALVFWAILAARGQLRRLPRQRIVAFSLMGLLFSLGSLTSFMAVEHIPAALAALLFYIYPAIVTAGSAIFFGARFSASKLAVLVAVLAGCALTVDLGDASFNALGVALALITPFFYSGYVLLGSRVTRGVSPLVSSAWIITVASGLMLLLGLSGAFGDRLTTDVSARGWVAILALAFFSTVISISTFLAGMARLDPFRASIISSVEPVVSVALAALLLDERLSVQQAAGGGVIVAAAVALQLITRRELRARAAEAV